MNKHTSIISIHLFALSFLLVPFHAKCLDAAAPATENDVQKKQKVTLDYKDPIHFMTDFLDASKKPEKPLKYWAMQLLLLLKGNDKLKNFCQDIGKIAKNPDANAETRATKINNIFIDAYLQNLFSEGLSKFILNKGLKNVKDAVKFRAKKI